METPTALNTALGELTASSEAYKADYIAVKLGLQQIETARDVMLKARAAATNALESWQKFNLEAVNDRVMLEILEGSHMSLAREAKGNRLVRGFVWIRRLPGRAWRKLFPLHPSIDASIVSDVLSNLMSVVKVGSAISKNLEVSILCSAHYQRQCGYIESETMSKFYCDDAIELQAAIEQAARHVHRDVESRRADIELLNIYSQTTLSAEVRSLTGVLVTLTVIIIILSLIAAVAALWAVVTA